MSGHQKSGDKSTAEAEEPPPPPSSAVSAQSAPSESASSDQSHSTTCTPSSSSSSSSSSNSSSSSDGSGANSLSPSSLKEPDSPQKPTPKKTLKVLKDQKDEGPSTRSFDLSASSPSVLVPPQSLTPLSESCASVFPEYQEKSAKILMNQIAESSVRAGIELSDEDMAKALRVEKEEGKAGYKKGGYCPVRIGGVFHDRYKVLSKVGWGHFSTVWKVLDMTTDETKALKIVRSSRDYREAAEDEIQFLKLLYSRDPRKEFCCMHLLDTFDHTGCNGTHPCMVFQLLGSNLLDLIKLHHYRGIAIPAVKYITKRVLIALRFIHDDCGVIHTDLKPENVLLANTVTRDKYSPKLNPIADGVDLEHHREEFCQLYAAYLADFGNATYSRHHFTNDIQTRQYRAPEVILGCEWNETADMWSLACMVFELITGDFLFEPKESSDFSKEDDHLAQIYELLGPFPDEYLRGRHSEKYLTRKKKLRAIRDDNLSPWCLFEVLRDKYKFEDPVAQEITDFLLPMLRYSPSKRATAKEMLGSPWLDGF